MQAVHAAAPATVATLDSPDARALAHDAAGVLSVAELLLPWTSAVRNVGVTTSQLGRKTCNAFPLQLVPLPLSDRGDPTLAVRELAELETGLASALARDDLPPLDIRGDAPEPPAASPWQESFRGHLLDPLAGNVPYDPLTHPVAILCAVSSRNPDPPAAMAELHAAAMAPDVLPAYMSTQVLRFYLLLHDSACTVPLSSSEAHLEQLKTTYGLNAALVPVNSRPPRGPTVEVEVQDTAVEASSRSSEEEGVHLAWGERYCRALRSPLPADTFARGLSLGDADALQAFLRTFVAQSLVPWMERSVQQWQLTLFDNKRGLTSRLWGGLNATNSRRLWGVSRATSLSLASAKSAGSAVSRTNSVRDRPSEKGEDGSGTLPPTTGGVMMRRLGDFAWTLHDYGFAMTCYEHAHRDLLLPELGRAGAVYAASAISQWGLARLHNELERRESPSATRASSPLTEELASQSLSLAMDNPPSGPLWSSAVLLLLLRASERQCTLLKQLGFVRAAASQLENMAALASQLRGTSNVSGVLYEQAALMRLLAPTPGGQRPFRRKAALDLVFAAEGYGDKPAAERAWRAAYALDSFVRWPGARAHVASRLVGKGNNTASLVVLLSTPGTTEEEVVSYLTRLAEENTEVTLPFGLVVASSLTVSAPGHDVRVHCGPGHAHWTPLLKKVAQEASASHCALPIEHKRLLARLPIDTEEGATSSPGGLFEVRFLVRNPWASPISLSQVEIEWDHPGMQLRPPQPEDEDNITLPPHAEMTVVQSYTSSTKGTFRPHRMTYFVRPQNGEQGVRVSQLLERHGTKVVRRNVWGKEDFDDLGPAEYTQDHTWDARVLAPQARVDIDVVYWPESPLYEGEEVKAILRLSNPSNSVPIERIRFALDQPDCALVGPIKAQETESRFPLSLGSSCISTFSTNIPPGDSTEVELLVRAVQHVSTIHLLVLYCDDTAHFAKVSLGMDVRPLIAVDVTSSPVRKGPTHWSLLCQTTNLSSSAVEIESLTVCSGSWALPALENTDSERRPALNRSWSQPILALQGLPLSSLGAGSQALPPGQVQRSFLTLLPVGGEAAAAAEDQLRQYTIQQLSYWFKEKNLDRTIKAPDTVAYTASGASPTGAPAHGVPSVLYPPAKRAWFKRLLGQVVPSMPARIREGAFLPHEPYGMDLCIRWRVHDRRGCSYVFNLAGAPCESLLPPILAGLEGRRRAMFAETDSMLKQAVKDIARSRWGVDQDPVQVTFRALPPVGETGENGLVHIAISVQNLSPCRACGVRLSLLQGGSAVQWVGRKTFALHVGPRQQAQITGHALAVEQGPLPGCKLCVQPVGLEMQHESMQVPGLVVRPVYRN